jgi:DNA-binding LytR/AlgR family response regulator
MNAATTATTATAATAATALIAEDEPLLAAALKKQLREAWPELDIVVEAADGESAIVRALDALPDILLLDISMPGKTGLAVAETVVDEWPETRPAPLIVFVTAYDEFAVAAFDREAVDYVLKPVTPDRIARTVERLRERLRTRALLPANDHLATLLDAIQALDRSSNRASTHEERLETIQVGTGNTIAFLPVADVLFFEATDKYVLVQTRERDGLIRMSMRDLLSRLDPGRFMQVHRSIVVNRSQIVAATRDDSGHVLLELRDTDRRIGVSRAFAHQFRAM